MCLWRFFWKILAFKLVYWVKTIYPYQHRQESSNPLRVWIEPKKGNGRVNSLSSWAEKPIYFCCVGLWTPRLTPVAASSPSSQAFGLTLGLTPLVLLVSGPQTQTKLHHHLPWLPGSSLVQLADGRLGYFSSSITTYEPIPIINLLLHISVYIYCWLFSSGEPWLIQILVPTTWTSNHQDQPGYAHCREPNLPA